MAGMDPDSAAQVRSLLGAGRLDAAAQLLRQALEADPACPELLRLRGQLALRQGDLTSARSDLEAARVRAPEDAAVLHVLAGICHAQGEDGVAETHLESALSVDPTRGPIWNSLGLVRHAAGHYQAALGAYDRALQLAPSLTPAIVGRAKVWQILGDLDAAERTLRQVLEADPDHREATAALAAQMLIRGQHAAGLALIDRLARRRLLDTELTLVRARLLRATGRPGEALASLETLDIDAMTATERRNLHYALGELHDELGRYHDAFQHFHAANSSKPGNFDGSRHRRRTEAICDAWSRAALASLGDVGNATAGPIFIVGMPRSGTTLVEQILAAHPDVHGAGELSAVGDLARSWRCGANVLLPSMVAPASVREAASGYLAVANPTGSPRFTDKMPANFEHLGLIQVLLPGARVVHCRRHPLDTALSCYFQDFSALGLAWSNRLEDIASYYQAYLRLMAHWHEVVSLPVFDLDYEGLVAEPETRVRRLLEFLDLTWHPDCLAHHRSGHVATTASHDQARRPIHRESVGRHRAYLDYLAPLGSLLEVGRG